MTGATFLSCGVDFGTSNSALALASNAQVTLVAVEGENVTLPSALFYPSRKDPVFGRTAMQAFTDGQEGRFMRSLKRLLGTPLIQQGTLVNGKVKAFEKILAEFIGHIKKEAERQAKAPLENVVMGRPVHFVNDDAAGDRRAQAELEKIARAVGFKNVEFQYEPIAAAFAHERRLQEEKLALVVDIGGGTSDFTVIRLSKNGAARADRKTDILANTGIRTGGNDFDRDLCLSAFMPPLGFQTTYGEKRLPLPASPFFDMSEWSKINFLYTQKTRAMMEALYRESHEKEKLRRFLKVLEEESGHRLLAAAEDAKIDLTKKTDLDVDLEFIEPNLRVDLSRARFESAISPHVHSISAAITVCLEQAHLGEKKIELIVLTGGTTEIPLLKDTIRARFPGAAISEENKLSSVGLGLGYDSQRRFNSRRSDF